LLKKWSPSECPKEGTRVCGLVCGAGHHLLLGPHAGYKQAACSTTEQVIYFSDLPLIFLKYFLYTAWPFVIVAVLDPTWRSKDAGNVFLAAYIAANVVWYRHTGCGFCMFAAAFRVIPCVFCALIAHSLGAWRHRSRVEE